MIREPIRQDFFYIYSPVNDHKELNMNQNSIMRTLKAYQDQYGKKYGILKLGIFGSAARNTSGEYNDIDIVITVKEQDLFNLIGIKQDLEKQFNTKVDMVSYRPQMNPLLKKKIDQEAMYV